MELVALADNAKGEAEQSGVRIPVDLSLIEDPALGDYVIIHAGYAIEKLDRVEAEARLELFAELSRRHREEQAAGGGSSS
jgi:hydrogenase expression/formation protein HypC